MADSILADNEHRGGAVKVPNRPSPEGRALGENLARFTEIELARLREQFPLHAEPCGTCAFRRGTVPNGCLATVGDALKCVMEGVPFMCHESPGGHEEKPSRACIGWFILSSASAPGLVQCPWPFSDEQGRGEEEAGRCLAP